MSSLSSQEAQDQARSGGGFRLNGWWGAGVARQGSRGALDIMTLVLESNSWFQAVLNSPILLVVASEHIATQWVSEGISVSHHQPHLPAAAGAKRHSPSLQQRSLFSLLYMTCHRDGACRIVVQGHCTFGKTPECITDRTNRCGPCPRLPRQLLEAIASCEGPIIVDMTTDMRH